MSQRPVVKNLGKWLVAAVIICAFGLAFSGCDRDKDVEEDPGSEVRDELNELEDPPTTPEDAYEELSEEEELEPTDIGPDAPAIYFVSGLKGYTEPCGCTVDVLLGGIDRITAFVNDALELHDSAQFIDAGDWVFEYEDVPDHLRPQEQAKAEVLADAHKEMGTLFSVPGERDLALGTEFYGAMMERAGMVPLGANIELDGEALQPSLELDINGEQVAFVGAGDPQIYEGIDGVEVGSDTEAVQEVVDGLDADVVVLVYQGDPARAGEVAESLEGVDFLIVGRNPRREEFARTVGSTQILEAYDQGRYVGRLKLYGADEDGSFVDGRADSREQLESLDEQIRQVREDLRLLNLRTDGEETPMSERLEGRVDELVDRRQNVYRQELSIPDDGRAFLYDLISMEPGYRLDETIQERRVEYNKSLAELNADIEREVIPVSEGEPFYVGTPECATCHVPAHDFWEETAHSSAVATLEERDKEFDQNCIGCHVVGWDEPGGSVMGKITYEAEIGDRSFTKDLSEVGCESCHGPGSQHLVAPLDSAGDAQHIIAEPTEQQCAQCHVPDHSPNFDFGVYVDEITGTGHEYSSGQ